MFKHRLNNKVKLFIGIILGYIFGYIVSGKSEGEKGLIHCNWCIETFKIHLHHWIIMSIILAYYLIYVENKSNIIIGFLIGGIIHGLSYKDRFNIIII